LREGKETCEGGLGERRRKEMDGVNGVKWKGKGRQGKGGEGGASQTLPLLHCWKFSKTSHHDRPFK